MSAYVMSTSPSAAGCLACGVSKNLPEIAHLRLLKPIFMRIALNHLALTSRPSEAAVNNRRAEEPLCDEDPYERDTRVAERGLGAAFGEAKRERWAQRGMREDQEEESQRRPEPANLNEPHVEDVALLSEIAGRIARIIGLRVR